MDITRYRYAPDFLSGTLNNVYLDSVTYIDPVNQNVAITPTGVVTGGATVDGSACASSPYSTNGGNAWTVIGPWYATAQANDYVQFTIPAGTIGVQITLSGILTPHPRLYPNTGLYPAAINNGAIAKITKNGVHIASLDCYNQVISTSPIVVASGDVIQIIHSGVSDNLYTPTGPIMIAIQAITTTSGTEGTTGNYVSAVVDSLETDTVWPRIDMEASILTGSQEELSSYFLTIPLWPSIPDVTDATLSFSLGNTPVPDSTWTTTTFPINDVLNLDQTRTGVALASLLPAGTGRYAQWIFNFPVGSSNPMWIRNVNLYHYVPSRDSDFLVNYNPVGVPWTPGPKLLAFVSEIAMKSAMTTTQARDIAAAMTIPGATGALLAARALDLGTVVYTGEPPASAQARLMALLAGRSQSGSPAVLANQVGRFISGQAVTLSYLFSGGLQTAIANNPVLTNGPVQVAQTGPWALNIKIPHPINDSYPGLPGMSVDYAQTIITNLITSLIPLGFSVGGAGLISPHFL